MLIKSALATAVLASTMLGQAQAATANFISSAQYRQFSDSPFAAVANGNANFFVETFEDGALNTPGVTASAGVVANPSVFADSVDGDDGALDFRGDAGHSWFTGGVASAITFNFNAATLGKLPTHAGLVWTDVGNVNGAALGKDSYIFEAFDAAGDSLGQFPTGELGDGTASGGGSAEDRFFGAVFAGGISRITLTSVNGSTDWELDHLQYGIQAVPLPGAAWMLAPALAGLAGLRRRRV